jgi:hypothetical protein
MGVVTLRFVALYPVLLLGRGEAWQKAKMLSKVNEV